MNNNLQGFVANENKGRTKMTNDKPKKKNVF